jgi:hypothetical protein
MTIDITLVNASTCTVQAEDNQHHPVAATPSESVSLSTP